MLKIKIFDLFRLKCDKLDEGITTSPHWIIVNANNFCQEIFKELAGICVAF